MKMTGVAAILKLKMAAKKHKQLLIQWNNWNAWYRKFVYRYQLNSYALFTRQYYIAENMPRMAAIVKSKMAAI